MKLTANAAIQLAPYDLMLRSPSHQRFSWDGNNLKTDSHYYQAIRDYANNPFISWEVPNDKPETATR